MRSCAFRCLDCSVDIKRSHAFDDCRVLVHGAARIQRPLRRHPPPTLCCLRSRPFDVAVSKEIIQLITQPCLLSPIHDSRPGQFSNCCFPIDPARAAKVLPSLLSITVTTPKVLCCIVARQAHNSRCSRKCLAVFSTKKAFTRHLAASGIKRLPSASNSSLGIAVLFTCRYPKIFARQSSGT